MGRKTELKKIIDEAQAELLLLDKEMTWHEACQYMYMHRDKKMEVRGIDEAGIYHSYEGIGILYSKHVFEGCHYKYRVR